jgi:hypothetical protein
MATARLIWRLAKASPILRTDRRNQSLEHRRSPYDERSSREPFRWKKARRFRASKVRDSSHNDMQDTCAGLGPHPGLRDRGRGLGPWKRTIGSNADGAREWGPIDRVLTLLSRAKRVLKLRTFTVSTVTGRKCWKGDMWAVEGLSATRRHALASIKTQGIQSTNSQVSETHGDRCRGENVEKEDVKVFAL